MIHVTDAVAANIFCMNYEGEFRGEAFEIGTGESLSLNEVRDIVHAYFPETAFDYHPPRLGDVKETLADVASIKDYGWEPSVSLVYGIHECFEGLIK